MKTNLFVIITTLLLMMVSANLHGQTKKEIYEAKKAKNDLREQQLQKRIEEGARDNRIIRNYAEEGHPAAQKLIEWNDLSGNGAKAAENGQFEQAKTYAESLIPGEDCIIEIIGDKKVVKLTSYHGFESYANGFSQSINDFNTNLKAFQAASNKYDSLYTVYTKKINDKTADVKELSELQKEVNKKMGEKNYYEKQTKKYRDDAIQQGETISRSTGDGAFKDKVDGFVKTLKSEENNTVSLTTKSKTVSEDYKNLLTKYLPGCQDCGNKQ